MINFVGLRVKAQGHTRLKLDWKTWWWSISTSSVKQLV